MLCIVFIALLHNHALLNLKRSEHIKSKMTGAFTCHFATDNNIIIRVYYGYYYGYELLNFPFPAFYIYYIAIVQYQYESVPLIPD